VADCASRLSRFPGEPPGGPQEVEYWFRIGNTAYVQRLEPALARALAAPVNTATGSTIGQRATVGMLERQPDSDARDGTLPRHLFGSLVSTEAGAELLASKVGVRPLV